MGIVSLSLTIITLNVNRLNSPIKDAEWLNGLKNKTQIYAAYKGFTSVSRTYIDSK